MIHNNYEFWKLKDNSQGQTLWRCNKYRVFKCPARLKTFDSNVIGNRNPDHNHSGNVATAMARKAIGQMKQHMTETIATPSSSQGSVVVNLPGHVQMALPKRASLSRVLRRHRQVRAMAGNNGTVLPPIPTDTNFTIPDRFQEFVLYDSGPHATDRILILGDRELLNLLGRSDLWIADGTFKVVPSIFFQLYSIHCDLSNGFCPAAVYCLLSNKNRTTYVNMLMALKALIPSATPRKILVDFESAAIASFQETFPDAEISGCYFHLCQAVIRKVQEVGLKSDYEADDVIRGFIRCLPALSHVPADDVITAFETLVDEMPSNEKVNDVVTYFEHTYIRGRRRSGRGAHYSPAIFPVALWNQFQSAGDGIARTTNCVEGWHHSLQALFMCQHPTLWTFLNGIMRHCQLSKAAISRWLQE